MEYYLLPSNYYHVASVRLGPLLDFLQQLQGLARCPILGSAAHCSERSSFNDERWNSSCDSHVWEKRQNAITKGQYWCGRLHSTTLERSQVRNNVYIQNSARLSSVTCPFRTYDILPLMSQD